MCWLRGLISYLLAVRRNSPNGEFYTNCKLAITIIMRARFKTVEVIAEYKIVLISYIDIDIRTLVLVVYFEFISYPGREK